MNAQALIEEVKNSLRKYSDAGLLDENSLYRDIVLGLKRFGNDVMTLQETVLEVKSNEARMPQGFFSLSAAWLCEPMNYTHENPEIHSLQSSFFYKERIEKDIKWSECDACCNDVTERIVRENVYFNGSKIGHFNYKNPQLLSLGKTFKKSACHSQCRNLFVRDNPNEIIINGTTLSANFKEGNIYMKYYGLPLDEEGDIEIPDSPNGHLETYLEYYLKRRAAEDLISNNDAIGLQSMYSVFASNESVALRNATNELKLTKITPRTLKRIARLNRLESLTYESWL